jgi:flagellar hook protein FlgE
MLSIVMSGLNISQKGLSVTANNMANAGTVGFKRSEASFSDVFANDPSTGSRVAIGSGATVGAIERSTAQGQLSTTDSVTDMAIAGRGYFTMLAKDPDTGLTDIMYTRAGNFAINSNGEICDSQGSLLQCFAVDDAGNISKTLTSAVIESQKSSGTATVRLGATAVVGTNVSISLYGEPLDTKAVTQDDINAGFISFSSNQLTPDVTGHLSGSYPITRVNVPLGANSAAGQTVELRQGGGILARKILTSADVGLGSVNFDQPLLSDADIEQLTANQIQGGASLGLSGLAAETATQAAASEFRGIFVQSISVSSKGMIQENYSDGSKRLVGAVALATFPNEAGLKPIGNTDFVACEASGEATLTQAGAPYAGDIHSGTLEQANVDITQELMSMLKSQQIYNGNARMMQTAVEVAQRITDKL